MTDINLTDTDQRPSISRPRVVGRWMITFVGFPLGGLAAMAFPGPIDSIGAALVGGLITGAILGAVQVLGFGRARPIPELWIAATAIGLMIGLGVGATAVDFRTSLGALVVQGAICGFAVGLAQGLVLLPRLGRLALLWPLALSSIWALGWAITTSVGVQVDEQFTVFGAAGAVVVTALTSVLPVLTNERPSS